MVSMMDVTDRRTLAKDALNNIMLGIEKYEDIKDDVQKACKELITILDNKEIENCDYKKFMMPNVCMLFDYLLYKENKELIHQFKELIKSKEVTYPKLITIVKNSISMLSDLENVLKFLFDQKIKEKDATLYIAVEYEFKMI